MSHTFYNSLDLTCKSPFGAVKAGQPVTFNLTVPEDLGYVDPHLVLTKDREDPVHYRMEFTGQTPKVNHFALTVTPTTSGLYFYHFDLYTDFRRIYRTPGGEGVLSWTDGQDWQLTVYEPDFKTPDWLKNGTMYQIFPDRFCEGKPDKAMPFADRIYRADKTGEPYFWPTEQSEGYLNMDYYGGDFAGIQQKLPYLRDLGVTCIYLNPIFEAHANHRYNTADYLKADPLLGTNEEFSALCAAAAKEGIRIILDGVFSHTGSDSRYFNREGRYGPGGAYRDRSSPYRSWYDFDSGYPCGYRSWWGFETLPEVQEESPSYVEFICGKGGVIDTWLNLGASGFRLDVADELPDDFIEKIRAAVKSHGEDKLLLGEVWEDATTKEAFGRRRTYLRGHGLDAVMNYPFRSATLDYLHGADVTAVADALMQIDRKLTRAVHLVAPRIACAVQKRGQLGAGQCVARAQAAGVRAEIHPRRRVLGQALVGHADGLQPPADEVAQHGQTAVFVLAACALDGAQHIVAGREHCRRHAQRVQVARKPGRLGLAGRHDAERLVEGLRQRGIDHRPARPRYAK